MRIAYRYMIAAALIAAGTQTKSALAQPAWRGFRFDVAAGFALQPETRSEDQRRLGKTATGTLMWRYSTRLGLSLQLLAAQFNADSVCYTVAVPGRCAQEPLRLGGAALRALFFDDDKTTKGNGAHYQLGIAVYHPYSVADHVYTSRVGVSAGFGHDFRVLRIPATLDVSFVKLPKWPAKSWPFIPVTFGFRW